MASNLNNLGPDVSTRQTSWLDLVTRAWGSEFRAPDHGSYEFGSGRKFDSTDTGLTGLYGVPGDALLLVDGLPYPDMRDGLTMSVGIVAGAADSGDGSYQEINADPRA